VEHVAEYYRANRLEQTQLQAWIVRIADLAADLQDAMCNSENDLVVDAAGLIECSRAVNLEAAHVNSLASKIRRDSYAIDA